MNMQFMKYRSLKPLMEIGETSLLLKRFRHSITPTRPKMPTWRRKVMVEFAKPVFSEKHPTTEFLWQECPRIEEDLKSQKESEPNAYEALYVKDLVNYMETSKMIGIYHFNAIGTRNYRKAWQNARRLQMNLETYEPVMVKGALDGTRWENLLFFLKGTNPKDGQRFVFCPEILPKSLLQFEKKVPEAYLMAAVVENRILDRAGVEELVKMPPLESLLGETVALLNSPAQKTSQLLNSNQQALSTNLSQYVKDQSGE